MNISKEHVESLCRPGKGPATCSFLGAGPEGWKCVKDDPGISVVIQQRREAKTIGAMADNCSGPPDFKPTGDIK